MRVLHKLYFQLSVPCSCCESTSIVHYSLLIFVGILRPTNHIESRRANFRFQPRSSIFAQNKGMPNLWRNLKKISHISLEITDEGRWFDWEQEHRPPWNCPQNNNLLKISVYQNAEKPVFFVLACVNLEVHGRAHEMNTPHPWPLSLFANGDLSEFEWSAHCVLHLHHTSILTLVLLHCLKTKFLKRCAAAIFSSIRARRFPTQALGPAPKGR